MACVCLKLAVVLRAVGCGLWGAGVRVCRNKPAYKTRLSTGGSGIGRGRTGVVWPDRLRGGRGGWAGGRDISEQHGRAWLVGHCGRLRGQVTISRERETERILVCTLCCTLLCILCKVGSARAEGPGSRVKHSVPLMDSTLDAADCPTGMPGADRDNPAGGLMGLGKGEPVKCRRGILPKVPGVG